ncbi:Abscisic acid G-protein coupled receptor-like domain [Phytophthora cactorum]|nr:Abscisic acid G-protein coupled receptor-like domain [Phytophthora cactorum]
MMLVSLLSMWALPTSDAALALGSWLVFFLFARFFFSCAATPLLFAASLTFSLSIFQMVLFEVTDVMHVSSRQWVWRVDLIAMTYLVVLVLPLSLFYALAREYGVERRQAAITACALLLFYLYGFWRLGGVLEPDLPRQSVEGASIGGALSEIEAGVIVVLVLLFTALFSIRNFVSRYMTFFWRRVAEEDIEFLEKDCKKRLTLELRASARRQDEAFAGGNKQRSFFSRAFSLFSAKQDDTTYIKGLEAEILTLESLGRELFLEIAASEDVTGRVFNFFGYVMSAFCVYKMVMSTVNVVFRRNRDKDPITDAVEKLLYIWPSLAEQLNIRFVSEVASLGFVGILVFTQTRGFLVTLLKFFRTYSSTVSSNSVVLWLAHLMGMYFVSSFVLMRMNLSPLHRQRIDEVLGEIEFNVFHRYFDMMFVVSASCSIGVLALTKFSKASRTANNDYGAHDKFP